MYDKRIVRDNPGEPVPEETFTHSHLPWSSIIPYVLPQSITIYGILPVQFTCLTVLLHTFQVFFSLPLRLAPSTSFSIHFFTQSLSSLRSTCEGNLFCCSTIIMSSNPSLSLSTLYLELYLVAYCHTSICPFSSLPAEVPPHFPF